MIEQIIHAGIINPEDVRLLEEKIQHKDMRIIFLDATFVLPTSNEDIIDNYNNQHIPGALFFDIKAVADSTSHLPHMVPDKAFFQKAISKLGITNNDIIITYGQHCMTMGPARAWWMFKGFGHDNVLVLNGGLPAWIATGHAIGSGKTSPLERSSYQAHTFNRAMIADMGQLINISEQDVVQPILDARPTSRFRGESPEPRDNMRSGHIPNSKSIPCSLLINDDCYLKNKKELLALFEAQNIHIKNHKDAPIITTCGSGITACALALALFHAGFQNVAVYDGSWSEWGLENSPTEVGAF